MISCTYDTWIDGIWYFNVDWNCEWFMQLAMDYWNRYFNNDLNDEWFMGLANAANAADEFGLDEFGLDEFGLDEFGLDEFGLHEFGLDEFGLDEFGMSTTWIQKENAAGFRCGQIKFGILPVVIEQWWFIWLVSHRLSFRLQHVWVGLWIIHLPYKITIVMDRLILFQYYSVEQLWIEHWEIISGLDCQLFLCWLIGWSVLWILFRSVRFVCGLMMSLLNEYGNYHTTLLQF